MLFGFLLVGAVCCLSYTLRDAQHLCWKTFNKINAMSTSVQGKGGISLAMLDGLREETGKVADIVKGLETVESSEKPMAKNTLATELSNILFNVFVLAEHYGINLEESFLETVNNYILKFVQ